MYLPNDARDGRQILSVYGNLIGIEDTEKIYGFVACLNYMILF